MRRWLGVAGWLVLPFVAAAVGSLVPAGAAYPQLRQPSWAPPAWLFGPVWSALFLMMGIAAALVWSAFGWRGARVALGLFVAQLAFNALWSLVFFGLGARGWAFAEILVLWSLILATLVAFWRRRPAAGALLVPYLAWVTFASVLNYAIWRLND